MRLQRDRLIRDDRGQALTEAAIGFFFFVMTFLLISYATFMASNNIRTVMAARHAAWMKGNGGDPTAAVMDAGFFFQDGLCEVKQVEAEGIASSLTGGDAEGYTDDADGPFRYEVSFGIDNVDGSDKYPFVLMKTKLPFMPETKLDNFLKVKSYCQWDEVSNAWQSMGDALEGIFNTIKNEIFGG